MVKIAFFKIELLVGCLFLCSYLNAVIVKAELFEHADFSGKSYLYSNVHVRPHVVADAEQLAQCISSLDAREKKRLPLAVLIEQPISLMRISDPNPSVTANLVNAVGNHYKYIIVENAEIRCASLAAMFVLDPDTNPNTLSPDFVFDAPHKEIKLQDLTITDVFDEQNSVDITQLPKDVAPVVQWESDSMQQDYVALEDGFACYGIRSTDRLLESASRLYNLGISRSALWSLVSDWSSKLFELSLFKRLVDDRHNNTALIAGLAHIQAVKQMLLRSGASRNDGYGVYFPGEEPQALNAKGFAILLE